MTWSRFVTVLQQVNRNKAMNLVTPTMDIIGLQGIEFSGWLSFDQPKGTHHIQWQENCRRGCKSDGTFLHKFTFKCERLNCAVAMVTSAVGLEGFPNARRAAAFAADAASGAPLLCTPCSILSMSSVDCIELREWSHSFSSSQYLTFHIMYGPYTCVP